MKEVELAVQGAQRQWADAVAARDIDRLLRLYASKAVLYPTFSPVVRRSPEEIRSYFEGGNGDDGLFNKGITNVRFVSRNPAGDNGQATDHGEYCFVKKDGAEIAALFEFHYEKQEDHWLIVHHRSTPKDATE